MRRRSKTRGRQGDWLVADDRSGFNIWASEAQKEWNGGLVHRSLWEARHPQDFVRGVRDDMRVDPARPERRPEDLPFVGNTQTVLILDAIAGDTAITVANTTGFSNGDWIRVFLDNGEILQTRVLSVNITIDNFTVTIDSITVTIDSTATLIMDPLPWAASIGNYVINISNATHADLGPLP